MKKIFKTKSFYDRGFYELIEHPYDQKAWAIEVRKGDWKGIVYAYGKVQIKEDVDKKDAALIFDLEVLSVPDYIKQKPITQEQQRKFNGFAQKILIEELERFFVEKERAEELTKQGIEPIRTEFDVE